MITELRSRLLTMTGIACVDGIRNPDYVGSASLPAIMILGPTISSADGGFVASDQYLIQLVLSHPDTEEKTTAEVRDAVLTIADSIVELLNDYRPIANQPPMRLQAADWQANPNGVLQWQMTYQFLKPRRLCL